MGRLETRGILVRWNVSYFNLGVGYTFLNVLNFT